MKQKKIIGIIVRIFIGLIFLASAITKYLSLNAFDIFIYEHQLFSWTVTTFVTRFLIAVEGGLGFLLILGVYPKLIKTTVIGFLVFFSVYILLKPHLFDVDASNCHCFGTILILTNTQTLIKNIVLLLLSYFMFWDKNASMFCFKDKERNERLKKKFSIWITITTAIIALLLVYLITPPDIFRLKFYGKTAEINKEKFEVLLKDENIKPLNIQKGKKVVCMYATFCKFCKKTTMRMEVVRKKYEIPDSNYALIFWGNQQMVNSFFYNTGTRELPHAIVKPRVFLDATKGKQPVIILMNNGKIVQTLKYPNIDEKVISDFIKGQKK
jgi:hypothetical protein